MHRVVKAVAHPDFTLDLTFDDGASGSVNADLATDTLYAELQQQRSPLTS